MSAVEPAKRTRFRPPVEQHATRLGTGSAVVLGVDNREQWPRRLRERLADHYSAIPDPSEAERSILHRAATLEVELERMESSFAQHGEASVKQLETYQRCANTLRRLLESAYAGGLERRTKDITTLGDLLKADLQLQRSDPRP
jgi:hypothetical protein